MLNFQPNFKGTMFSTDLDGTMFLLQNKTMDSVEKRVYDTDCIQKVEQAVNENNIDTVVLSTGRNFTELKEIEDILKRTTMPIGAITLEDGKRILNKPKNLNTQAWLKMLFNPKINYMAFSDKSWAQNNNAPLELIGKFLIEEKGFIHRKDNGEHKIYSKPLFPHSKAYYELTLIPPGILFDIKIKNAKTVNSENLKNYSQTLTKEIQEMLKSAGYNIEAPKTTKEISYRTKINRADINKGTASDHIRAQHPNITSEIRAGNAENDIKLLKTTAQNTQVIQVGTDSKLKATLKDEPNAIFVGTCNLANGINKACERLNLVG